MVVVAFKNIFMVQFSMTLSSFFLELSVVDPGFLKGEWVDG